jgi:predicted amidohydrolase YtcJ
MATGQAVSPEAPHAATEAGAPADLVLLGAVVITNDPAAPRTDAVAIRGGRILALGRDVDRYIGQKTQRLELGSAVVLPGLVDAHAHLAGLGERLATVDLNDTRSYDELLERVKAAAEKQKEGYIIGRGWDQNDWPDKKFPSNDGLERVAPGRTIWLRRVDGHAGLASARALSEAGVTDKTKDPPGGRILRDGRTGRPTGVLVDAAMKLVSERVPPPPLDVQRARLRRALETIAIVGLTGVHDMGVSSSTLQILRELEARGELPIRVYAALSDSEPELSAAYASGPKSGELLSVRAVKFYADGALGSRGAALLKDYADERGNRGLFVTRPEELAARIVRAMNAGFQPCVHAIGDAANRAALDAFEAALKAHPEQRALRPRIEHAQVVALDDIPRFASLGVIASMQPTHATSDMPWAEARLGPERLLGAYAWQRFRAARVTLAFGSDFPVERPQVLEGLYAALTRTDREGKPAGGWLPDQRSSFGEALDGFTAGAAYAEFAEQRRGRIAPGFDADLTVVDGELAALATGRADAQPIALLKATIRATLVSGRIAYQTAKKP